MTYALQDVIDIPGLQRLMENFHAATGIPGCILDTDENILVSAGWQEICSSFHRVHPVTRERCLQSDAHIKSHLPDEGYVQYRCMNGMWDVAVPIVIAGEHVATLFFGQFFYTDEVPDAAFFLTQARECGFDTEAYLAALAKVPLFSQEKVRAIIDYSLSLVSFLVERGLSHLREMEAERALRQRENRYHAIFDSVPLALFEEDLSRVKELLDELKASGVTNLRRHLNEHPETVVRALETTRILGMNDTALAMYRAESRDALAASLSRILPPESIPVLTELLIAIAEGRHYFEAETVNRRLDGEAINVIVRIVIPAHDAAFGNLLVCVTDITEQKRTREEIEILHTDLAARAAEMEATNRELEAFSHSLSHDLRSPLTAIYGVAHQLADATFHKMDDRERSQLQLILDGCEKIDGLLTAMLTLSRVGQSQMVRERADLSELARKITLDLRMAEPRRQVEIVIAPGLTAWGDTQMLGVALDNLLGNAWKYTRRAASPRIELGEVLSGQNRVLFVQDNGVGFPMEQASRLFQPFQRLCRDEDFEGSGIGLATVQRVIQRHGGRLWAESRPGEGAAFFFTLPEAPPPPQPAR